MDIYLGDISQVHGNSNDLICYCNTKIVQTLLPCKHHHTSSVCAVQYLCRTTLCCHSHRGRYHQSCICRKPLLCSICSQRAQLLLLLQKSCLVHWATGCCHESIYVHLSEELFHGTIETMGHSVGILDRPRPSRCKISAHPGLHLPGLHHRRKLCLWNRRL